MKKDKRKTYPNINSTASSMDSTGMIPTPPQNSDEWEAYEELTGMELPKKTKKK